MTDHRPNRSLSCPAHEHTLARRSFLQGSIAGGLALGTVGALAAEELAEQVKRRQKRMIFIFLMGGASQFETFDPKPGTDNGGPYAAIDTKLPGVQFCEHMPRLAAMNDKFSVIRTLQGGGHGSGNYHLATGHTTQQGLKRGVKHPFIGSIVEKELGCRDAKVPNNVTLSWAVNQTFGDGLWPGYLGPQYTPLHCPGSGLLPSDISRHESVSQEAFEARNALRRQLAGRFEQGRSKKYLGNYNAAYNQVRGLMSWDHLFDLSKEPANVRERYGDTRVGRDCLTARRLVEAGCPFVYVQCYPGNMWDLHHGLVYIQRRLTSTFDATVSVLIEDLIERGLWDDTLLVCCGEMGRTPKINKMGGRDHWGSFQSALIGGGGIQGGMVIGATNENGTKVKEGRVLVADLHRTCYQVLGIDADKEYEVNDQPVPLLEGGKVVEELFA